MHDMSIYNGNINIDERTQNKLFSANGIKGKNMKNMKRHPKGKNIELTASINLEYRYIQSTNSVFKYWCIWY